MPMVLSDILQGKIEDSSFTRSANLYRGLQETYTQSMEAAPGSNPLRRSGRE